MCMCCNGLIIDCLCILNYHPCCDEKKQLEKDYIKNYKKIHGKKPRKRDIKYIKEKFFALRNQLREADRRFNIAISKIGEFSKRIHELEVERNTLLKNNLIANILDHGCMLKIRKELIKDVNLNYNDKADLIYQEVIKGYKSMSNRKNELEEERNIIVKYIEELGITV